MPVVIRSLIQDHANTETLLAAMERQITRFAEGDSADMELLRAVLEYLSGFPDACHHPKEDLILQKLRETAPDRAVDLERLEEEHRELAAETEALTSVVDAIAGEEELPRGALIGPGQAFIANYRRHMAMEEKTLFKVAAEVLSPEDWLEVGEAIYRHMDPVFGNRFDAAYSSLRADLDAAV